MLHLTLGGAALQRCGNCIVLSAALTAEVTLSARKLVFPQPLQPCRSASQRMRALGPDGQTSCPDSLERPPWWNPAPEGRTNLAQRFSAGKRGRNNSSPGGTTQPQLRA